MNSPLEEMIKGAIFLIGVIIIVAYLIDFEWNKYDERRKNRKQ